jgi:hypothetical protein
MKWKYISSMKTCIYPERFPNVPTVTWSLVQQTRNLANKIEDFSKCDDFSGEIRSAHRYGKYSGFQFSICKNLKKFGDKKI